eukprot:scaffold2057_cov66-Cylindrotheca_fusiformis.AAC.1
MDDQYVPIAPEPSQDFKEFYPYAEDTIPEDMPEPRGKEVQITMSPILWYSKKQNSIETSTFGSEFMALKTGMELLEGL